MMKAPLHCCFSLLLLASLSACMGASQRGTVPDSEEDENAENVNLNGFDTRVEDSDLHHRGPIVQDFGGVDLNQNPPPVIDPCVDILDADDRNNLWMRSDSDLQSLASSGAISKSPLTSIDAEGDRVRWYVYRRHVVRLHGSNAPELEVSVASDNPPYPLMPPVLDIGRHGGSFWAYSLFEFTTFRDGYLIQTVADQTWKWITTSDNVNNSRQTCENNAACERAKANIENTMQSLRSDLITGGVDFYHFDSGLNMREMAIIKEYDDPASNDPSVRIRNAYHLGTKRTLCNH